MNTMTGFILLILKSKIQLTWSKLRLLTWKVILVINYIIIIIVKFLGYQDGMLYVADQKKIALFAFNDDVEDGKVK